MFHDSMLLVHVYELHKESNDNTFVWRSSY